MNINSHSLAKKLAMDALMEEILHGEEPKITYSGQAFEDGKAEQLKPEFKKMFNEYFEEFFRKIQQHQIND